MTIINKIQFKEHKEGVEDKIYDVGATFDNVVLSQDDSFSLKDLYTHIKSFFEKDMFMMYSKKEPKQTNVKVWYKDET